jgi:L-alanine-DL-glutamate epimerase-like enolase superfamily enzyme
VKTEKSKVTSAEGGNDLAHGVAVAAGAEIESVRVSAYKIPTDAPESDGTYEWDSTTLVLVEIEAGGQQGIGYTYADEATARLIESKLAAVVEGRDALDTPACWIAMTAAVRNLGRPGIAAMAVSAVDVALWDLKGKLLGVSLVSLLGAARCAAPVYGSGGFTSYSIGKLAEQLGGWVAQGIPRVKMKIGRDPQADLQRVARARAAIGSQAELFVDANGAYSRKQALAQAEAFSAEHVTWFEEPVSSDDLQGLRLLRDRAPAPMAIAAGEYGYDSWYFRRMLEAGAVDVLQADATRAGGITGFLQAGALCEAFQLPLSAHCAPSLHAALGCSVPRFCHLEYFHDHARIEHLLFDGALDPEQGALRPDRSRPGLGIAFKSADAERFRL